MKIKRLRELGFSYHEIRDLLMLDEETFQIRAVDLLKRHHQAADDLLEKIRRLEKICHGEVKTESIASPGQRITTFVSPHRTAYRIKTLDETSNLFQAAAKAHRSEITIWKFNDFLENCDLDFLGFDLYEIFSQSALATVLEGAKLFPLYVEAWKKIGYSLDAVHKGQLLHEELSEFFSKHEIVIDHRFIDGDGKTLFRILLSYQAVFIKTVGSATHAS